MLTLYEELYILVLDEEKGNLVSFARKTFAYAIAGLILSELALMGKLGVGDKLRLMVNEGTPTGDPILDATLDQIRGSDKAHKPTYWVSQLSEEPKKLRQSIGERLVEGKMLVQDDKRFFRPEQHTNTESAAPDKFQLKQTLRGLVFQSGEVDVRNLTLLKMIAAGDLLCILFTPDETMLADKIINKQLLGAALGNPVMEVVGDIGQAVSSIREEELE